MRERRTSSSETWAVPRCFRTIFGLVTVPGPATGQAASIGTPTGVVFNPGAQFTITQGSITEPAKFIFATDTGTISAWTERKNADGSFDRPSFAKLVIDRSSAGAHYFGIALSPGNDRIHVANFGANAGIQTFDSNFQRNEYSGCVRKPVLRFGNSQAR